MSSTSLYGFVAWDDRPMSRKSNTVTRATEASHSTDESHMRGTRMAPQHRNELW